MPDPNSGGKGEALPRPRMLQRRLAAIVVADADRLPHIEHEDFAVADLAGAGRARQGLDHFVGSRVGHDHFEFDLGQQVHLVLHTPINLFVALLAAVPAHFDNGHTIDANILERFLYLLELVWLDDGFDLFHRCLLLRLEVVTFFAVHAEVETFALIRLIRANSGDRVAHFENDIGPHDRQHPGHRRSDRVVQDLPRIAVHQAHRLAHSQIVDLLGGENAGEDGSHGASDAVYSEGVQRVVITEFALDHAHHQVAH